MSGAGMASQPSSELADVLRGILEHEHRGSNGAMLVEIALHNDDSPRRRKRRCRER